MEEEEEDLGSRRVRRRKLKRGDSDPGPVRPEEDSRVVKRFAQRYVGHSNLQTDIKEAVFMGPNDEFVVAGSDDGRAFLYDSQSGELLRVLAADEAIVNCVQPHPHDFVLATSGIDSSVKLWSPIGRPPCQPARGWGAAGARGVGEVQDTMEEGDESDAQDDSDEDLDSVTSRNQAGRSQRGPTISINRLRRFLARGDPAWLEDGPFGGPQHPQCAQQ